MRTSSLSRQAAVAAVAAAVLVLSACGDDSSDSASEGPGGGGQAAPSVSADEELAALVPDAIAEDGVITVGSDSTYAPAEFLDEDGQTIIGFDVDLFGLVAQKLGLRRSSRRPRSTRSSRASAPAGTRPGCPRSRSTPTASRKPT